MSDEAPNSPDGLDPKQEEAVVALLNNVSVRDAAKTVGVHEKTLYRWLDQPAFSAAYRKARRQSFAQAIALTNRYAPMAVNTLASISNDKAVAPSNVMGATKRIAESLLDLAPQDIKSIEVLKDAAASSVYGSRGANGVILIVTKRGEQP